jgi:predicted transcriptional regulator
VSKHLQVLEAAGLVSRTRDAQRRPAHLEAKVFEMATRWLERYRRQAEERYRRLDDLLQTITDEAERARRDEAIDDRSREAVPKSVAKKVAARRARRKTR